MVSLVLTLKPETIAIKSRFGLASAFPIAPISAAKSEPAQAIDAVSAIT